MNSPEGMVFGCMTPEEQSALRDAKNAGAAIDIYINDEWLLDKTTFMFSSHAYRIAPPPVEPFRVDPIVWQVLDPKWRWFAADRSGAVFGWRYEPIQGVNGWDANGGCFSGVIAPGLIRRGTCPWQEAIAERPEDTP